MSPILFEDTSTKSNPTMFLFLRLYINFSVCLGFSPHGDGVPTDGAKADPKHQYQRSHKLVLQFFVKI